ncbi:SPOR domain-containing protein [Pontixanthobacter sp.]|uniref:SPOR domain-containing protein n=1 Tax=Pontixanthobacter sp. TaxID=2792078 RepID=UPI003C7D5606
MRLPTDLRFPVPARFGVLGLAALLASCGGTPGDGSGVASAASVSPQTTAFGPEADFPVVIGQPFTVDGQLYTPSDTLNYDQVGYASTDSDNAMGVTASHKTLPLPSYIEVTSLDSGKTILVRVERRGPMTSQRLVGLSPAAQTELGISAGSPVRIRRVNAPEADRAKLRMGQAASPRIETPASLVAILKRKLPESGSVSLAQSGAAASASIARQSPAAVAGGAVPSAPAQQASSAFADKFAGARAATRTYPLPPLAGVRQAATPARVVSGAATAQPASTPSFVAAAGTSGSPAPSTGKVEDGFVVQAAAFSSKSNADRVANSIDGFVEKSGRFYRVRKGPFANRGQAEAALAKVREAGYNDARVFSAG